MTSRFDDVSGELIGAVRAGQTLERACRAAGISVHTVKGWARKGRRDPESRFAAFAVALEAARNAGRSDSSALEWDEFEQHLAKAIRGGSVQAMRLYASLYRPDEAPAEPGDAFERFDELARRRERVS